MDTIAILFITIGGLLLFIGGFFVGSWWRETISKQKIKRKRELLTQPVVHPPSSQCDDFNKVGYIMRIPIYKEKEYNTPNGFIPCDGTEYKISEYPELAEEIKKGHGEYNYFGGDGINTFCVPSISNFDDFYSTYVVRYKSKEK